MWYLKFSNGFMNCKMQHQIHQQRHCIYQPILALTSLSLCVVTVTVVQTCRCGSVFLDDSVFCRKCGTKRPGNTVVTRQWHHYTRLCMGGEHGRGA